MFSFHQYIGGLLLEEPFRTIFRSHPLSIWTFLDQIQSFSTPVRLIFLCRFLSLPVFQVLLNLFSLVLMNVISTIDLFSPLLHVDYLLYWAAQQPSEKTLVIVYVIDMCVSVHCVYLLVIYTISFMKDISSRPQRFKSLKKRSFKIKSREMNCSDINIK